MAGPAFVHRCASLGKFRSRSGTPRNTGAGGWGGHCRGWPFARFVHRCAFLCKFSVACRVPVWVWVGAGNWLHRCGISSVVSFCCGRKWARSGSSIWVRSDPPTGARCLLLEMYHDDQESGAVQRGGSGEGKRFWRRNNLRRSVTGIWGAERGNARSPLHAEPALTRSATLYRPVGLRNRWLRRCTGRRNRRRKRLPHKAAEPQPKTSGDSQLAGFPWCSGGVDPRPPRPHHRMTPSEHDPESRTLRSLLPPARCGCSRAAWEAAAGRGPAPPCNPLAVRLRICLSESGIASSARLNEAIAHLAELLVAVGDQLGAVHGSQFAEMAP